jgi:DNA-binding NtrC family response regulator
MSASSHHALLVADDDPVTRTLLRRHLEPLGFAIRDAVDGAAALQMADDDVLVALVDLQMPKVSGLECLKRLKKQWPDIQVLMISGEGEISDAVAAMKQGASDYLSKPFDPEKLRARVQQAIRSAELARERSSLKQVVGGQLPQVAPVIVSSASRKLWERAETVAALDEPVLIVGPSGTGKTTIARSIHQMSGRTSGPFVSVSCAALPRDLIEDQLFGHDRHAFTGADSARAGLAEVADGGTLFLDEIGDLPLDLQPKLLTFLDDHSFRRLGGTRDIRVDVRVIAATHQDLESMVRERTFRLDLFYRLNTFKLEIPPLAGREEDILELARRILTGIAERRHTPIPQLSRDAERALTSYAWPGNIRELDNVLQRASAFARGDELTPDDLMLTPTPIRATKPTDSQLPSLAGYTLEEIETRAILDTLAECDGNRAAAARRLGISERTMYNKMKRLRDD